MNPLLAVRSLSKAFGPTHALRSVDFTLLPGTIHALVGENGAGKSTLIKILAGVHQRDAGTIELGGQAFIPATPLQARQAGISTVFQELSLCPNLTVAENVFAHREPARFGLINRRALHQQTRDVLAAFNVSLRPDALLGDLTVAQRQIVEIVKAMSVSARILVFDEPTSALGDRETGRLLDLLLSLKTHGTGIIYVSHKLEEIFKVADEITVFRDGQNVATLPASQTSTTDLMRLMVGREITQIFPAKGTTGGEERLRVSGLRFGTKVNGISFTVHAGEIVGLAGLTGSGRTECMQALIGYTERDSGDVVIQGKPVELRWPADAIRNRILYAPEDRKEQGLFLEQSVTMNISVINLEECSGRFLMSAGKEEALTRRMTSDLGIKSSSPQQEVGALSGGNQQKVLIARCLAGKPDVLIVDEPTRGIDIGSKIEIYHLLRSFANRGGAVMLISSELLEVVGLSDRVLIFCQGAIAGELEGPAITEQNVLSLMFSHTETTSQE
ncbi:MAG: sugar ABC transporter ATP-binding protein [Bacteroidota bacterium]